MRYSSEMNVFIISALLISALLAFTWKKRKLDLGRYFLIMLSSVLIWVVFFILELASEDLSFKILATRIQISAASFIPVLWIYLVYGHFYKSRFTGAIKYLLILPAVTNIILWLVPRPNVFWGEPELVYTDSLVLIDYDYRFWQYYIHSVYSYALLALAVCVLIVNLIKAHRIYKNQTLLILFSLALPTIVGIGYAMGISPNIYINYTSAIFSISCFMLFWAFYKYKYLELIPRARTNIIEHIEEGVLVIDDKRRIVDMNPAALKLTGLSSDDIGIYLFERTDQILKKMNEMTNENHHRVEIGIEDSMGSDKRTFDIKMTTMSGPDGGYDGAVFIISDQTEKKSLYNKIYDQSIKDELTGLYNRRYLFERGGEEIDQLKNEWSKALSLMVIDIDGMKDINDKYGHVAGDQVIKSFSDQFDKIIRSTDIVGRIGGDEFVLILPDTDKERAKLIAGRVIERVNGIRVKTTSGDDITVRVSIGIVHSDHFTSEDAELENMYRMADKMMYDAKNDGGNKAVCYDGLI